MKRGEGCEMTIERQIDRNDIIKVDNIEKMQSTILNYRKKVTLQRKVLDQFQTVKKEDYQRT